MTVRQPSDDRRATPIRRRAIELLDLTGYGEYEIVYVLGSGAYAVGDSPLLNLVAAWAVGTVGEVRAIQAFFARESIVREQITRAAAQSALVQESHPDAT